MFAQSLQLTLHVLCAQIHFAALILEVAKNLIVDQRLTLFVLCILMFVALAWEFEKHSKVHRNLTLHSPCF